MRLDMFFMGLWVLLGVMVLVGFGTGLYLCFSASIIIGACSLLFFPLATITGLIYLFSGSNLAIEICKLLGL